MDTIFFSLQEAIYEGSAEKAKVITELALEKGYSIKAIAENALFPAMEDMGNKMGNGEIFMPEVLMSSRAMHAAMYALKPIVSHYQGQSKGTVIIGTVEGDLHNIGKDMVSMFLAGMGFSVIDLGVDVSKEKFAEAIRRHKPDILALSALLTTTMPEIKRVIDHIVNVGLRSQVSIMVGGAAVTAAYARECRADVYTKNMFEAAEAAKMLIMRKISKYSL